MHKSAIMFHVVLSGFLIISKAMKSHIHFQGNISLPFFNLIC